jgi:hypothetical protein
MAAMVVVLLLLVGCSGAGGSDAGVSESAPVGDDTAAGGTTQATGGEEAPVALGGAADEDGVQAPELEPLPDSAFAGQRIIKEGTVSIEVEEGNFDAAFQTVIANARRLGGDVVGSSTQTSDDGDTIGSVTVRVPVEDFEDLLVDMTGIGTVRDRNITSQDVSTEFTDLESRLRHLEALERFYLGLFDEAESVNDAISVQQKLGEVQGQIEKAQGRLNLLDDRTSFSTLTVEIFEPGAGGSLLAEEEPTDRPTLARYWDTARDAFVNVVGAMLVVVLFLLPLLVPLAFVAFVALRYLRRRRPSDEPVFQTPAPQPEPEPEPEPVEH